MTVKLVNAVQGYGWLKDRILGEEGRRQQMLLRELGLIAEQLGCSLAQLAIGQSHWTVSRMLLANSLQFHTTCTGLADLSSHVFGEKSCDLNHTVGIL